MHPRLVDPQQACLLVIDLQEGYRAALWEWERTISRARVMIQAKALLAEGRRADEVVRATRAFYYRDALLQGLSRYTLEELLAFPTTILQADRTLKSRSIHPRAVLENLVDRLTGPSVGARGQR